MSDQIELYAPKPGSLPWRILKHLQGQPEGTELGRRAIGSIFAVDNTSSLDTLLQLACARGVLKKGRNGLGEVTWRLGDTQCALATTRPVEETPASREEEPAAAPAPAVGKWSPTAPRALPAVAPAPVVKTAQQSIDDIVEVAAKTTESMAAAFAEVFGEAEKAVTPQATEKPRGERIEGLGRYPAEGLEFVVVDDGSRKSFSASSPGVVIAAPASQRKQKRGTASAKPRPAAKPYLAEILAQPLSDPARLEAERYVDWLSKFDVGHSAIFRLAHIKAVEGAVSAFAARTRTRFRVAKVSQYRAGIERTA